ncbi:phosphotransferase enzyme family protein [Streptomyces sp. NBC_00996]|uniref:phosphotransferase enzyme family protein n=1 Tax=Streptomyces sp. NBC_00996 TaxID=2903710 RepID=UPI00386ACBBF|nr:phosphotransferase [Streptomyces sp. NBC_00996]
MHDGDWEEELTADMLAERYGFTVEAVERVPMGTDTVKRRVLTSDGRRLFVKEYASTADLDAARSAWDMSEFCRAADLPVPRVWPDRDGDLIALSEGSAWAVVDEAPGRVATTAMSVARAEHIGMVLGRMHRVLAAYPLPKLVQQSRWRTGSVEDALAKCSAVSAMARRRGHGNLAQLREQLDQRRQDLTKHVCRLRAGLPEELVEQALHADFTRPNMLVLTDVVTGIIDFRSARAFPSWELGRAAFDPRTVATGDQWAACATAMVSAYRSENPSLPLRDVLACLRIALLYMLFSFYGATTSEYGLPHEAEVDLQRHWQDRLVAIRRLLDNFDDLEDALKTASDRPGDRR